MFNENAITTNFNVVHGQGGYRFVMTLKEPTMAEATLTVSLDNVADFKFSKNYFDLAEQVVNVVVAEEIERKVENYFKRLWFRGYFPKAQHCKDFSQEVQDIVFDSFMEWNGGGIPNK